MTITSNDVAYQVSISLTSFLDDFDVKGIVEEIKDKYGLVDIDTIDESEYWEIVARHDITEEP